MSFFSLCSNLLRGRGPGQLVIQFTDRCNAACPQCGMRVTNPFPRTTLELDHCKTIIDKAAERGVSAISFTGGEPMLYCDQLAKLISHAGQAGIKYTRTGTNGFFLCNSEHPDFIDRIKRHVDILARSPLRNFWISLDSGDRQTHEQMRNMVGLLNGLAKALPIFHDHGLFPTANLGLNRNLGGSGRSTLTTGLPASPNRQQQHDFYRDVVEGLDTFITLVRNLGFSIVNFCYPMSVTPRESTLEAVYPASSVDHIVHFSETEIALLFQALSDTIARWRSKIRIFTPRSSLYMLMKSHRDGNENCFPCRGGNDYFFINSKGRTFPCGYRGNDDLGDYRVDNPRSSGKQEACTRCDWECFRDPSELFGPVLHGFGHPHRLFSSFRRTSRYYRLWLNDLAYYRACRLFDGRRNMDPDRLAKFIAADRDIS